MSAPNSVVEPARRLVNKADFERLLAAASLKRSAHFALHHVAAKPLPPRKRPTQPAVAELSTAASAMSPKPVDESPVGHWLGCVVPKRHARRSTTRSLLKRQIRGAFDRHCAALPAGLWLVRLRGEFSSARFVSAQSRPLALAARAELDHLLGRATAA